jgi:hypothetical protein
MYWGCSTADGGERSQPAITMVRLPASLPAWLRACQEGTEPYGAEACLVHRLPFAGYEGSDWAPLMGVGEQALCLVAAQSCCYMHVSAACASGPGGSSTARVGRNLIAAAAAAAASAAGYYKPITQLTKGVRGRASGGCQDGRQAWCPAPRPQQLCWLIVSRCGRLLSSIYPGVRRCRQRHRRPRHHRAVHPAACR